MPNQLEWNQYFFIELGTDVSGAIRALCTPDLASKCATLLWAVGAKVTGPGQPGLTLALSTSCLLSLVGYECGRKMVASRSTLKTRILSSRSYQPTRKFLSAAQRIAADEEQTWQMKLSLTLKFKRFWLLTRRSIEEHRFMVGAVEVVWCDNTIYYWLKCTAIPVSAWNVVIFLNRFDIWMPDISLKTIPDL